MSITVTLWSGKPGEIREFMEKFYQKDVKMEEGVDQWIYVYRKPLDAIDIISTVMDNNYKYNINVCLQVNDCDLHPVTNENYNDIIKGLFYLFYEEASVNVG